MTPAICAGREALPLGEQKNLPVPRPEASKRFVHHGLLPVG